MKKFLLAALSASLVASPILAAAPAEAAQRHESSRRDTTIVRQTPNRTVVTHKQVVRQQPARTSYRTNWRKGERFDSRQARNYRVVNDYRGRHLKAPPRGYHYVQSGNDALLVGVTTGVIAAVLAGVLR